MYSPPVTLHQLTSPRFGLDPGPQLPRRPEHGHVVGVLEVGEADDARQAAARAELMGAAERLDTQHARAARRQLVRGGAAHRAQSDDDRVVSACGVHWGRPACMRFLSFGDSVATDKTARKPPTRTSSQPMIGMPSTQPPTASPTPMRPATTLRIAPARPERRAG